MVQLASLKGAENKMGVMVQRREGTSSGVAGQRRGGVDSRREHRDLCRVFSACTLPLMPSEAGRWDCSIQPGGKSWAEVADHTRAAGLGRGSQL